MKPGFVPLPIDDYLDVICAAVDASRAAVVTAAPGAGKTTRVPPALAAGGRVLLLQPRRVAARAIARRVAIEQGWTLGREVGWHVRFDRRESADTRLLVATEGILTARLQQDPLLSDFRTIVLDEFHERSIHADLGLTLARQAWMARSDLRLVVMSATMDTRRVARYLNDCPVIDVPGRSFPIEITYAPGRSVDDVVLEQLPAANGAILCFLPGAGEIRKIAEALNGKVGGRLPVLPLHGGLDADAQDAVLTPAGSPRVILATNIAETTLTVPDVRVVVDAGWQKVARYDAERGIDSLETERISTDAADQRAGRAGRVSAGRAVRVWDARDRLHPHREPDIMRVDLAAPLMEILAWGGDPRTFDWFEAPPESAIDRAMELLESLGAVEKGRLTDLGQQLRRLPVHPRLGRVLVEAKGTHRAAVACAILSERHFLPPAAAATPCDLLAAIDRERDLPPHIRRVAADIERSARQHTEAQDSEIDDTAFRRAVLGGYRDRLARRRAPGSDRFLLASGTGARLGRESGVALAEFIVAVDIAAGGTRPGAQAAEAIIRMATGVDREWIMATSRSVEHHFDGEAGRVRARAVERVGAVTIREREIAPDPEISGQLLVEAVVERGPLPSDVELLQRLTLAGVPATFESLVQAASPGAVRCSEIDLRAHLSPDVRRTLERLAPEAILLPSGRSARLSYFADGRIVAAVKLQELFGLADSPRVGRSHVPVTFELLSPAGRPVQVTTDLRSFWTTGYQEVRKELRPRYPKHPWPEDPWTAPPTHRTTRRRD